MHRVKVRLLRGGVKAGETRKMSVDGTFFRKYPASAGPGGRPAEWSEEHRRLFETAGRQAPELLAKG